VRVLDLFCKQGGAGRGYADAGFDVVGVDKDPQPRYPFEFIRADVLGLDVSFLASFDLIHASPPCQFATLLRHAPGGREHPNLIAPTRELLMRAKRPYVIENVEPAREHLIDPIRLCGTMFGLGAQGCDLHRHRLFETSFDLRQPDCAHNGRPVIGVYGGHARKRSARHGGRGTRDVWRGGHKTAASEAMGVDWMTLDGLSEAIPPAYTEWIARQIVPPRH
jgi:DNA (cytosine-5)-methyltransferase 1